MGRSKKRHKYDPERVMRELLEAVVEVYTSQKAISLRQVTEEFGITLLKARKLLITAGAFSTETSEWVYELHTEGKSVPEIMELTGLGRASVHSYLPYERGAYKGKEISADAERAQRYRLRKFAVQRIAEAGRSGDVEEWKHRIWEGLEAFQGYWFYTAEGEKFRYEIREGEMVVDREKGTISRETVDEVLGERKNLRLTVDEVKGRGKVERKYLISVLVRIGAIEV